jgi:hypothetical protein
VWAICGGRARHLAAAWGEEGERDMTDDELCIHIEDIIRKHTNRHDDTPLDAAQKIVLGLKKVGLLVPDGWVAVPQIYNSEMVAAGDAVMMGRNGCSFEVWPIFDAMLAARPKVGEGK